MYYYYFLETIVLYKLYKTCLMYYYSLYVLFVLNFKPCVLYKYDTKIEIDFLQTHFLADYVVNSCIQL